MFSSKGWHLSSNHSWSCLSVGCSCGFGDFHLLCNTQTLPWQPLQSLPLPKSSSFSFLPVHERQLSSDKGSCSGAAGLNRKEIFVFFKTHRIVTLQATEAEKSPLDKGLLHKWVCVTVRGALILLKLTCLSNASLSFSSLSWSRISRFSSPSISCCFRFSSHNISKFSSAFFSSLAILFPTCYIPKIFTIKAMLHLSD